MNDAPSRMRGFEAKRQFALAVAIERNAAPNQILDGSRCCCEYRPCGRLVAKAVAGFQRIGKMQFDVIAGTKTGSYAALGERTRRFQAERRLGQENYGLWRQGKRGGQA